MHKSLTALVVAAVTATGSANALETSFVWANEPDGGRYSPNAAYVRSDGAVSVTREGTGLYRIDLGAIAESGGNVQVTANKGNARCQTRNWASGSVWVTCHNASGAPANSEFQLLFTKATSTDKIVYAWVPANLTGTRDANRTYLANRGRGAQISRQRTGVYRVNFGALPGGGNVQATAYGRDAAYCSVGSWGGGGATINCFGPNGAPKDTGFTVLMTPGDASDNDRAYAWTNQAASANYTPDGGYSNNPHGVISASRTSAGQYKLTLTGAVQLGGNVQVSAYGSGAYCRSMGWGANVINVACADAAGNATDSRFSVLFTGAGQGVQAATAVATTITGPQTATAATEVRTTIEAPRFITARPWPSARFYVIKTGTGDNDFAGNGPSVDVSAQVSHNDNCIHMSLSINARETRPDNTRGRANVVQECIWRAPANTRIIGIQGTLSSSASYTDTDWQMDAVVPGRGEVDGARTLPASDPGPVHAFLMIGDTNGDEFSNNNDGNDVGPAAVEDDGSFKRDAWGNRFPDHQRTSAQVKFNPMTVEIEYLTPPPPPTDHETWIAGLATPFFTPPRVAGDDEFGGNGPDVDLSARLSIVDSSRLRVDVTMSALEVGGDTRAGGGRSYDLWTAPPGWRLLDVGKYYGDPSTWVSAIGRRYDASYRDDDHELDFIVVGYGEEKNIKESNRGLTGDAWAAIGREQSPIYVFSSVGDTNGGEAGTKTGMRVHYRGLDFRLQRTDPAIARTDQIHWDKYIPVPHGDTTLQLSGGNSCGPSAGSRVVRFYGGDTTYELFKRRVLNSGNAYADQSNGTPPGTLRDRMNDVIGGFRHDVLPLARASDRSAALTRIKSLIDDGKPVMTLIGWGSNHLFNVHAEHQDSDGASLMLHWVVIRGYDDSTRRFSIVDNGHEKYWSYETFMSVFDYGINPFVEVGTAAFANTEKGSIIYRE